MKSKIRSWLPWLALSLIIAGQLIYLPARLDFLRQLFTFAQTRDPQEVARLAYGAADYDLLAWVAQETSPKTTILLLTASPHTYGDPSYVLYHRAIYYLYPRSVWWAAPVPPTRYPAWWVYTDLTETDILKLAQTYHTTIILADGFVRPPVSGSVVAFDNDTHLIFLDGGSKSLSGSGQGAAIAGRRSVASDLFKSLVALLSIWLWGDLLYRLTLRWSPLSLTRRLAVAWLLGCGVTSLGGFVLLWAGLALTQAVIIPSLLGPLLWLYVHRKIFLLCPCSPAPLFPCSRVSISPSHLFFLAIIFLQVSLVVFAAWASPLADWDAWVNWASKANAIFIDQTLAPTMYHNPARLPTNMDYPLMLPLVEAWFYTWLGHIHEPIIGLISFLFYVSLLLLFYDTVHRFVSPTAALGLTALLATIPRLERPAHSGLADIPLAALVFLSFLLIVEIFTKLTHENKSPLFPGEASRRGCSSARLLALALSTGFLPWLKNEGWLWWGLVSLALLVGLARQVRGKRLSLGQSLGFFLIYSIPTLVIPLLWQFFLTMFGTYRFTFLPLTLANFWTNLPRLSLIGWGMFTRLMNPYWNFVWLLAGLTLLIRRQRVMAAPLGWLIWPIIGYLMLVSLAYVFSRFDPFLAQLNNSVERLILQATPVLLWWLVGQSRAIGWLNNSSEELVRNEGT